MSDRLLVLVDRLADKARAEAMDLGHGAMFVPPVWVADGQVGDCAGARVVVVTAGAKQHAGETRLDLATTNTELFRRLIPGVLKVAPDAILLIVSNPVDVLTRVARQLSGLPPERVLGSGTVLDTSRFRFLLCRHFGVSPANVHAYVIGEHGDSEVPVWSSAQIGNVPLDQVRFPDRPPLDEATKQAIVDGVRGAAGEVIKRKGATNWAVGLSVARILRALLRDERVVLTVSRPIDAYHDVRDACVSVPWLITSRGAESPLSIPLNQAERDAFRRSAEVVRGVTQTLGF